MDYFRGATGIGTLCCLGLLWVIDLVSMFLRHPTTHTSCCMDVSLYSRVLFGKKLTPVVNSDDPNVWAQCLQEHA